MKIYRNHNCQRQHRTYVTFAKCVWPRAAWVTGEGPYALVAWCVVPTVTLWQAAEPAQERKREIDRMGCGGRCVKHHEVILLRK